MRFWVIPLFLVFLFGCGSATKRKAKEPNYRENDWETKENSANLVNLFYNSFWSKSFNEIFDSPSGASNFSKKYFLPEKRFKTYRGEPKFFCKKYEVDGYASPVLSVSASKDYRTKKLNFSGVSFGYLGSECKYMNLPFRYYETNLIHYGAVFVKDAKTLRNMFLDIGVPLTICHEGGLDKARMGYYNSHWSESEGKKTYHCFLGKNHQMQFRVDYGVLSSFSIDAIKLTEEEKYMSFSEVFRNRFQNKKYFIETFQSMQRSEQSSKAHASREMGASEYYNKKARIKKRASERRMSKSMFKSMNQAMSKTFQEQKQFEDIAAQRMEEIARYESRFVNSRVSNRKTSQGAGGSSGGSPLTLTSTSVEKPKQQPKKDCVPRGIYGAINKELKDGPISKKHGKPWCDWHKWKKSRDDYAAKKKAGQKCPARVPENHCAVTGYGREHCRTVAKRKGGSCTVSK